jgi:hypothetical protein
MKRKRLLPSVQSEQSGLGLPTIMDRDLAATHGVLYVHLAVFAIDIDRVYWQDPEDSSLPFGWEVFLTECFLLQHLHDEPGSHELLEALCVPLLEETPGEPPLGGQIVFAIYDAVRSAQLPPALSKLFSTWQNPPRELLSALDELDATRAQALPVLAQHCLSAELTPPLAPPTREALLKMREPAPPGPAAPRGM